jgi:hypothetical protein
MTSTKDVRLSIDLHNLSISVHANRRIIPTGAILFAPLLPQRRLSWQSRLHRHRLLASARKQTPSY